MSNENDDNDRLSIPLEGALKRVQEESGLFRSNVGILLFMLLMFPLVISKNIPPVGSALVLIVAGFMIYHAWGKCRYAKKLLKFYDGHNIPAFSLDSAGADLSYNSLGLSQQSPRAFNELRSKLLTHQVE